MAKFSKTVITLDENALAFAMQKIWEEVVSRKGQPDLIVGIATGGLVCARILEQSHGKPLYSCTLRRPSSKVKARSGIKSVIGSMPYPVSNMLRRAEDYMLERRSNKADQSIEKKPTPNLFEDVAKISRAVENSNLQHILVIDDAVDSGSTLRTVVNTLSETLPKNTKLSTAVIVQTRLNTSFAPEFALYYEALCRFPWSFDFKSTAK